MSAPTTEAPRWATTTLAEHASALTALQWLAEQHPDLPSGVVHLSAYRREGQPTETTSRELQVQVRTVDEVHAWAGVLGATAGLAPTRYTPGRTLVFVDGSAHDVHVHVWALLAVEVLDDDALERASTPTAAAVRLVSKNAGERHLHVATRGGAR
ncbi:hypothetical protein [Pseudokineococcus lusitanus]|uniref:Uncharacterized protein n=1 Tax=Pseudokineococcus lusitanus TaxID=763993 RepID=A0A3N1HTX5_9ACTN|nr:hypothetical protein [Pseudokineococcus lusitanus]ROP45917.1 hypothetical protein EDC03_0532 [Pseudokineococcus lusitanus]